MFSEKDLRFYNLHYCQGLILSKMKMASLKLSIQDKKELDKFTKFFVLKAAQIIVQSRFGDKVHTKCKPHSSGTDWVSLVSIFLLLFLFNIN